MFIIDYQISFQIPIYQKIMKNKKIINSLHVNISKTIMKKNLNKKVKFYFFKLFSKLKKISILIDLEFNNWILNLKKIKICGIKMFRKISNLNIIKMTIILKFNNQKM